MKRLKDAEVIQRRGLAESTTGTIQGAAAALVARRELDDDHLQARGDVKRLAARLQQMGPLGNGHDVGCAEICDGTKCDCVTGLLLSEVSQ